MPDEFRPLFSKVDAPLTGSPGLTLDHRAKELRLTARIQGCNSPNALRALEKLEQSYCSKNRDGLRNCPDTLEDR